jgi:hypothetical protein
MLKELNLVEMFSGFVFSQFIFLTYNKTVLVKMYFKNVPRNVGIVYSFNIFNASAMLTSLRGSFSSPEAFKSSTIFDFLFHELR